MGTHRAPPANRWPLLTPHRTGWRRRLRAWLAKQLRDSAFEHQAG